MVDLPAPPSGPRPAEALREGLRPDTPSHVHARASPPGWGLSPPTHGNRRYGIRPHASASTLRQFSADRSLLQARTHLSSRMIGTAEPFESIPSTFTSGPPIMKSVWTLEVFTAPAGGL